MKTTDNRLERLFCYSLYHVVLSNIESVRLAPILPFSVCDSFDFSSFTLLIVTSVQFDPAQQTEKRLAPKKCD